MPSNRNRIEPRQDLVRNNFTHFIKHQKKYITLIMLIIFSVLIISNFVADKPVISGSESYYYLSSLHGTSYNPLVNLIRFIPENLIFLIPLFIGIFSVLMIFNLSKHILDKETSFFFILFLVLTPAFIFSFVTLYSYGLFLLLTLLGFFLIYKNDKKLRYLSLLPFILATLFDTLSALVLLILQLTYLYNNKNKNYKDQLPFYAVILTVILLIFNQLVLEIPLILGPFHKQILFTDLISDLGGSSGLGLFITILALIGLIDVVRRKDFKILYLLPILIIAYFFNTNVIFFIGIITSLLASFGFIRLIGRNWNLLSLKKFTAIILILGILFSTLAYMNRLPGYQPLKEDREVLSWIMENTPEDSVILSSPENTYLIKYFAGRDPLSVFDHGSIKDRNQLSEKIFSSLYIRDLFPLLEDNNVDFIYINRNMKKELPKDQGFLFLLKNERFKLIYSSGDSEVWVFEKEQ